MNQKSTIQNRKPIKHYAVATLVKCVCGKTVPEEQFEKHLFNEAKKEALEGIRNAMYTANDPNASWSLPK